MVRKIFNFFIYLLFFIAVLIYFAPKIGLYYLAEQQIKPFGVIISQEEIKDNGFALSLQNANISLKGVDTANIGYTDLKLLVLYNSLNIQKIELSSMADSFAPLNIDSITITHSIINPLFITGEAKGGFGEGTLNIDILKRVVTIKLIPSKNMKQKYKSTLRNLKKNSDGEYIYEKNL
ncbi:MAG: hypothetical protein U9P38_06695 [Campylobacterota bacterium]|nr:hypothetical protein [Campylobacterota bacterium]